jgi:hypothetical protein
MIDKKTQLIDGENRRGIEDLAGNYDINIADLSFVREKVWCP